MKTILAIALLATATKLHGANIQLLWDPNPSQNIVSYKVYSQQVGVTNVVSYAATTNASMVDGRLSCTFTVTNLVGGQIYSFSVAALSASGVEEKVPTKILATTPLDPTTGLRYKVVQANSPAALEEFVGDAIADGWMPTGGIESTGSSYNFVLMQAMVKKAP